MIHSKDFVTNLDDKCIQPNAVDLRVDKMFRLSFNGSWDMVSIVEDGPKTFFDRTEVPASFRNGDDQQQFYQLTAGVYEFHTKHEVFVPEGVVGNLQIRSTLARNGITLANGIYDSGFKGAIGGILHIPGYVAIEQEARVAQFYMMRAETNHSYDGYYNKNGHNYV